MPDLETLTAGPRSDLLPDYTLSPFTLRMLGQVEGEFKRQFLATVAASASECPPAAGDAMLKAAALRIELGALAHGTRAFDIQCFGNTVLPFLVWTAVQPLHPEVKRRDIEALVPAPNGRTQAAFAKLQRGVLELMGFTFPAEGKAPPKEPTPPPTSG